MNHGIVTSKKIGNDGHVIVTVQSSRAGVTWPNVPVAQSHPGAVQNIKEGWHVALDQCDDGLWVVVGVLNTEPSEIPNTLDEREQSVKFGDGTEISVLLNDSGNYDVTVSASGNVTINADGNVTIGDADNAESIAIQNHTHDTTLSDGSTGTSGQPNENGTETTVQ